MASLWAHERALKVIHQWRLYNSMLSLPKGFAESIAEAIEEAEQYGENRYKEQDDE